MTLRRALHYLLALVVGLTFSFAAAAPSQAALPDGQTGPQHFAQCFWLMLTDSAAHAAECGPSQVVLPQGFPATGTSSQSKPNANCCPCTNDNVMELTHPFTEQPDFDVADNGGLLSPDDLRAAFEEWLVACCPCGPPPI